MKFAKEAISNKAEFVPSAIGFDNAYPEHREQKFNGDSGWHTWMVQRIDNITAEAARIGDHSTHVNHLQQTQVEDLSMDLNYLIQRLHELETETTNINHVTANQQEEDITKKKKHKVHMQGRIQVCRIATVQDMTGLHTKAKTCSSRGDSHC